MRWEEGKVGRGWRVGQGEGGWEVGGTGEGMRWEPDVAVRFGTRAGGSIHSVKVLLKRL